MVNMEKVIEGLQCMSQRTVNDYDDEELWCESCGYDHDMCMIDIVSDSIALLKEQEEQIKTRDESLEKAREEIKWLRGMLKEQEKKSKKRIATFIPSHITAYPAEMHAEHRVMRELAEQEVVEINSKEVNGGLFYTFTFDLDKFREAPVKRRRSDQIEVEEEEDG